MPSIFVKGLIIGFALSAPVGPIAAICVQRTLNHGRLAGSRSPALAPAAADAVYGTAAAFGASFISGFLVEHGTWLQKVGGGILITPRRVCSSRGPPAEGVTGAFAGSPDTSSRRSSSP